MTDSATGTDRFRAILVLAATIGTIVFNSLAAMGRVGGVTPAEISAKYQTMITPAGYAFSIWSLIYVGLIAFSIYQLLPANLASIPKCFAQSSRYHCSIVSVMEFAVVAIFTMPQLNGFSGSGLNLSSTGPSSGGVS